jgi:hypothetical protein
VLPPLTAFDGGFEARGACQHVQEDCFSSREHDRHRYRQEHARAHRFVATQSASTRPPAPDGQLHADIAGWLRVDALAPHAFTLLYAPLPRFVHARTSRFALVPFPLTIADLGHS